VVIFTVDVRSYLLISWHENSTEMPSASLLQWDVGCSTSS